MTTQPPIAYYNRAREFNLTRYFAEKVLHGNQHVIISIVGTAGYGKSMLAAGLVIGISNYLGAMQKRDPRYYFNFKDNLACINRDRLEVVFSDPKEYNLLWADDIGVGMNARRFMNEDNIDLNDVLQTFRPNKNIVILTTQYAFLLDKVPRTLSHYHIEMQDKLFETQGVPLTTAKVNQILYQHRYGKTYYPFLTDKDRGRFVLHLNYKVPDVFLNEYDKIRMHEFRRLIESKKDKKEGDKEKPFRKKDLFPYVERLISERGWTQKEACGLFDMSTTYYQVNRPEKSTLAEKIT